MSNYDFGNFGKENVDEGTRQADLGREKRHISIVYHQAMKDKNNFGFFTIDREDILEQPGPFWNEDHVQFGRDPNSPAEPVWKTDVLRAVPIAKRSRHAVVYKENGIEKYQFYPEFFPRDQKRTGHRKYKQIQVMFVIPELGITELPLVLNLKGFAKTVSWDNDHSASFNVEKFPRGAWNLVLDEVAAAEEANGWRPPEYCFWLVDFRGKAGKNGPLWVEAGMPPNATWVNPLTADMRIKSSDGVSKEAAKSFPASRFVGAQLYEELSQYRAAVALKWRDEWKSFDGPSSTDDDDDSSNGNDYGFEPGSSRATEEDLIPF